MKHFKQQEKDDLVQYLFKETKKQGEIIFKKNEVMGETLIFIVQGHLIRTSTKTIFAKQNTFVGVDNVLSQKYTDFYDDQMVLHVDGIILSIQKKRLLAFMSKHTIQKIEKLIVQKKRGQDLSQIGHEFEVGGIRVVKPIGDG